MKHVLMLMLIATPYFALSEESEMRYLCIGEALTELDIIDDTDEFMPQDDQLIGKPIISDELPSDFGFLVTLIDGKISVRDSKLNNGDNYLECEGSTYLGDFACSSRLFGRFDMFYFSMYSKRFLNVMNQYSTVNDFSWEPYMVGGKCVEM